MKLSMLITILLITMASALAFTSDAEASWDSDARRLNKCHIKGHEYTQWYPFGVRDILGIPNASCLEVSMYFDAQDAEDKIDDYYINKSWYTHSKGEIDRLGMNHYEYKEYLQQKGMARGEFSRERSMINSWKVYQKNHQANSLEWLGLF